MLTDEEFDNLRYSGYDLEGERQKFILDLKDAYLNIQDILKKYCDLEERYYPIISLWIIGTYAHDSFETYPYLFLNASKGSGKSRLLRLISILSKNGEMLGSMTEAVLFRGSKGNTICIDEFENIQSDEKGALRELLNAAYKKGSVIKRFRKKKTLDGEKYEPELFDVYTPIAMANINGMERVLADRCICLVLEKSSNTKITRLIEDFKNDFTVTETLKLLQKISKQLESKINNSNLGKDWNDHVLGYFREHPKNTELTEFFHRIDETGIEGRNLELLLPLYFISYLMMDKMGDNEKEHMETIIKISKELVMEKEEEESLENNDRILVKFLVEKISHELEYLDYISATKIANQFREYLGEEHTWINAAWIGKSLKRLKLIKGKKRETRGIKILLDHENKKLK